MRTKNHFTSHKMDLKRSSCVLHYHYAADSHFRLMSLLLVRNFLKTLSESLICYKKTSSISVYTGEPLLLSHSIKYIPATKTTSLKLAILPCCFLFIKLLKQSTWLLLLGLNLLSAYNYFSLRNANLRPWFDRRTKILGWKVTTVVTLKQNCLLFTCLYLLNECRYVKTLLNI